MLKNICVCIFNLVHYYKVLRQAFNREGWWGGVLRFFCSRRQIKCDHHSRAQVLSLFFCCSEFFGDFSSFSVHEPRAAAYTTCSPTVCALFGQESLITIWFTALLCHQLVSYMSCSHTHSTHWNLLLCLCLFCFFCNKKGWLETSVVESKCGQLWQGFLGFPFSFPPCVFTHRAQPCLSFPSQDPITLYPCAVPAFPQLLN